MDSGRNYRQKNIPEATSLKLGVACGTIIDMDLYIGVGASRN